VGGRKSYSVKKLIGNSRIIKKSFSTLKDFLEKSEIKSVGKSAFNVFSEAKKPLEYSAYSNKLGSAIIANYFVWKLEKDDNKLRREIGKVWSIIKTKYEIVIPKEVDRIIVETAFKSVRGRKYD
jgi:hypothetical protein